MARPVELGELISILKGEHVEVRRLVSELQQAIVARKYAKAAELVSGLCDTLRQHIIDEEAKVLKAIIDDRGRHGADEAIRIAQRHRLIHEKIEAIEKLAGRTPGMLGPEVAELDRLLAKHIDEEEHRMFPQALEVRQHAAKGP